MQRRCATLAAFVMAVVLAVGIRPAFASVSCDDAQKLVEGGQLDTAERLLASVDDDCREQLQTQIDEARAEAARALSIAQRLEATASSDDKVDDEERQELLVAYSTVLSIDGANDVALERLAGLTSPPATTSTTTTTLAPSKQAEELIELGLDDEARAKAVEALAQGTLPEDLADDLDRRSLDGRLTRAASGAADTAITTIQSVLASLVLALAAGLAVLGWIYRSYRKDKEHHGYRLVLQAGKGAHGEEFAASVRAALADLDPWSNIRASPVFGEVPALPKFEDVGAHFRVVDWLLQRLQRRRWTTVRPTVIPKDDRGASVTLELNDRTRNMSTTVRSMPPGAISEEYAAARVVPAATAWVALNWNPKPNPETSLAAGTSNAASLGANLAGLQHLASHRVDEAHSCFLEACTADPNNVVARQNLLLTSGLLSGDDVFALISVLDAFDDLIAKTAPVGARP